MEDFQTRRKIENSPENREKCHCRFCPSYPHECKGELLFCARGKSNCEIEINGCICNTCPVYFENQLEGLYYCDKDEIGEGKFLMRSKRPDEDESFYKTVVDIKNMSFTGKSVIASMGSLKKLHYSLDALHFIPAQVNKIPLNMEDRVNTEVIIGKRAKKPFKISSPIMISGLSFGAVSKNVRLTIAQTANKLKIGFNSGEGGVLTEELDIAKDNMIAQYSTGRFGVNEEILKSAAAVEIRFGQGAYPGKGSFLPAEKMTSEIAEIRGLKPWEAAYSPAHHPDMKNPHEIKEKVKELRKITGGVPIGAKIGCGDVKKDVEVLAGAEVDFIALDGFGGGTGATDICIRDNVGIPIFAALPQALKTLEELEVKDKISLIAGGKLFKSSEFAKCLALGADAVYIGTAALIAINCEQYRICYTGMCPTGITTQDPQLANLVNVEESVSKLSNFINVSTGEIANFSRVVGKDDVNKFDKDDLISFDKDLSVITGVKWLNGEYYQ
jgi:glutamate synthase domain-containing protein 2